MVEPRNREPAWGLKLRIASTTAVQRRLQGGWAVWVDTASAPMARLHRQQKGDGSSRGQMGGSLMRGCQLLPRGCHLLLPDDRAIAVNRNQRPPLLATLLQPTSSTSLSTCQRHQLYRRYGTVGGVRSPAAAVSPPKRHIWRGNRRR